jgi:type VI secretion system Hcp family effector
MTIHKRFSSTIMIGLIFFATAMPATAAIYVLIPGVGGDLVEGPDGSRDWFLADSFSFGIEREMKESGEKGGTADINIGVGELQECTISKRVDSVSPKLAQAAADGRPLGSCEICFAEQVPNSRPQCYLHYVMEPCYVKSWSTSGDADDRPTEEVAFYFNKIAFGYSDAGRIRSMSWGRERNRVWDVGLGWLFNFHSPD